MANIYANENFPSEVVECLRHLGHDVLTTHDTGKSNLAVPDEDVLTFATAENRAVLTFNRKDFFRLHRENQNHAGIIACKEDLEFEKLAERIHEVIQAHGNDLNCLVIRVNRPKLG